MKKITLMLVLLAISFTATAQCPIDKKCDPDTIKLIFTLAPKHGDVDEGKITANGIVHTVSIVYSDSFILTFLAGGLSCTDTMTRLKWFKDGKPIGNTCNDHIALPVEFIYFTSNSINNKAHLSWGTASEINNSHFEVEEYIDEVFVTIATIEGSGNSNSIKEYHFSPDQTSPTSYYRIKQVDFNGSYSYTNNIVRVSLNIHELIDPMNGYNLLGQRE